MDEYELQEFPEIWDRVTANAEPRITAAPRSGADRPTPPISFGGNNSSIAPPIVDDDEDDLRDFIKDELSDCRCYRELACRCRPFANTFRQLAADEARHAKQLRTAYFILTGESFSHEPESCACRSLSEMLRKRYLAEMHGAEAYQKASENADGDRLRELFLCLSHDEARHACIISDIIGKMMD